MVRISAEEKIQYCQKYVDGEMSQREIARTLGIATSSVQKWLNKYLSMGEDAFTQKGNKRYSIEEKTVAVESYLKGEDSLAGICRKYKIKSTTQLQRWILKYNGHEDFKVSGTGGYSIMTKGRKTTFDERVEIVQYCIKNDHNYAKTAETYNVSYQQARNYTVKYEESGVNGLRDRRGRRKPEEEMSELERLRAENRILKAEKEHAEMEASFLKKLREIERRRG